MAALELTGLLSRGDTGLLHDAYLFFRTLIDSLRIVYGHAKDLVLPALESESFVFLARRTGYTAEDWQTGARKLAADIERHMQRVREFFDKKFSRN